MSFEWPKSKNSSGSEEQLSPDGVSRREFLKRMGEMGMAMTLLSAESRVSFAKNILSVDQEASHEKIARSFEHAVTYLQEWIAERTKRLPSKPALGPNLDQTYYYRLGDRGTDGFGMTQEELSGKIQVLEEQGFPRLIPSELELVNIANYFSRRDARPDIFFVAKHFTGGDPTLEVTEESPVHYGAESPINTWVNSFRYILGSKNPPRGIMLSHASYNLDFASGNGKDLAKKTNFHPSLADKDPSLIPASLNSAIISYLREELGYSGLIIPDWYNMKSIESFVDTVDMECLGKKSSDFIDKYYEDLYKKDPQLRDFKVLSQKAKRSVKIILLAVHAGVDIATGIDSDIHNNPLWGYIQKMYPSEYRLFEEKLNVAVSRTLGMLGDASSEPPEVSEFTLAEKLIAFLPSSMHAGTYLDARGYVSDKQKKYFRGDLTKIRAISGDIWNRTGVMTLILRKKFIEELTGDSFGGTPKDISEENAWFYSLMKNKKFRQYYDEIDWNSNVYLELVSSMKKDVLDKNGVRI